MIQLMWWYLTPQYDGENYLELYKTWQGCTLRQDFTTLADIINMVFILQSDLPGMYACTCLIGKCSILVSQCGGPIKGGPVVCLNMTLFDLGLMIVNWTHVTSWEQM